MASKKSVKIAFEDNSSLDSDSKFAAAEPADEAAQDGESTSVKGTARSGKSGSMKGGSILYDEDADFFKKWSSAVILGPFFPCVIAVLIIVTGEVMLNTWKGTCGYPLDTFISAAVAICYLYVVLFSWVFIGDNFHLKIAMFDLNLKIFQPFSKLQWLMVFYVVIVFISFIVWIIGSTLLTSAYLCVYTAPALYSYTTFLVAIYWLGFCIGIIYFVKLLYGDVISSIIKENVRAPSAAELEDKIFRKCYQQFDKEREGHISRDDVGNLLQVLGVYIPENELPALLQSFDPTDSGIVKFEVLYDWFKQLNSVADNNGGGGGGGGGDD